MMRNAVNRLRRYGVYFLRDEYGGPMTVGSIILFPVFFFLMLAGIELAFVNLHHAMLERAVDITVRDIRLGTGTAPQHDDIKDLICARAGFIEDCSNSLRLEMIQVDPRNWSTLPQGADCIDRSQPVEPVRAFVNGLDNELMLMRACAMIDPVFPTSGLGKALAEGGLDGRYGLIAVSAFVQEPR